MGPHNIEFDVKDGEEIVVENFNSLTLWLSRLREAFVLSTCM